MPATVLNLYIFLFYFLLHHVLQSLFYKWENGSAERLSDISKVTHPVSWNSNPGSMLWKSLRSRWCLASNKVSIMKMIIRLLGTPCRVAWLRESLPSFSYSQAASFCVDPNPKPTPNPRPSRWLFALYVTFFMATWMFWANQTEAWLDGGTLNVVGQVKLSSCHLTATYFENEWLSLKRLQRSGWKVTRSA